MKLGRLMVGMLTLLLAGASGAYAQTISLTASSSGNTVQLNWTADPGATAYGLEAYYNGAPAIPLTLIPGGAVTSLTAPNLPFGTYMVRITSSTGAQSNVAQVIVAAAPPPAPAAPANLAAIINGRDALLSWTLASTTNVTNVAIQVGSVSGSSDIGTFPVGVTTSFPIVQAPVGQYYVRVVAAGPGGVSSPSNELVMALPGCTAPPTIPLTINTFGTYVSLQWPQVPGALGYRLDVAGAAGGAVLLSQTFGASQTSFSTFGVPLGSHFVTLHTELSCGAAASSGEQVINVDGTSGNGPRRPAGSVGAATATAEVLAAGRAVASQSRGDFLRSCGSSTYLFKVLQRLRTIDSRYGLNWKRGVVGAMSDDVIVYNFSDVPDDQARAPHLYAWDVIGGHCGPNPTPIANMGITNPNGQALWTILPYLQRGFAP